MHRDDRMTKHLGIRGYLPSPIHRSISFRICFILLAISFLLFSCASAKINQFSRFSELGSAYSEAIMGLTKEAGNVAIDADSTALVKAREVLTPKERGETIIEHNKLLRERIELLRDLRRQAQLLRSYFQALAALAKTDAPSGIGAAAEGVVSSLGKISERIKDAKVGALPVSEFIGPVVKIVVAQFQRGALEKELRVRAPIIERELDLQQAALQAIANQMRTDLQVLQQREEALEVVDPFRATKDSLPSDWTKRRKELLNAHISLDSVDTGVELARNLKLSFLALVEDRLDVSDVETLFGDINEILTLIEDIQGTKSKNKK
jgi:dynactin complex subunit